MIHQLLPSLSPYFAPQYFWQAGKSTPVLKSIESSDPVKDHQHWLPPSDSPSFQALVSGTENGLHAAVISDSFNGVHPILFFLDALASENMPTISLIPLKTSVTS